MRLFFHWLWRLVNFIVWMQGQLSRNKTEDKIIDHVNELCNRLPSPMGELAVDCHALSSMPCVSFTLGGCLAALLILLLYWIVGFVAVWCCHCQACSWFWADGLLLYLILGLSLLAFDRRTVVAL